MANRESTFKYKQNLSSKEFGFLLYHTFPKGVYSAPSELSISQSGAITCIGGTFVFYDSTNGNKYGIKIDFNDEGPISKTATELDINKYVFAKFKYNNSGEGSVSIEIKHYDLSDAEDAKENYIRLARIYKDEDGYKLDTTSMELASFPLHNWNDPTNSNTYVCNPISIFEYNANAGSRLKIELKGDFILGSNHSYNPSLITEKTNYGEEENIIKENGYYVFLDMDGEIKVCKDTISKQGKFVIAEKTSGNTLFNVYRNPICVNSTNMNDYTIDEVNYDEIDNKSILPTNIQSAKDIQDVAKYNNDKINMNLIINGLMNSVDNLIKICISQQNQINDLINKCQGISQCTDPAGYTDFNKVRLNGTFLFKDNNSRLGSADNPINELYVKNTLYTDTLNINNPTN